MITSRCVGRLNDKDIHLITMCGEQGLQAQFLSLGAAIYSLLVPDKNGNLVDVCLGYEQPQAYIQNEASFGICIGRCAGRIKDAQFSLHNKVWTLPQSDPPNHIHGGFLGFGRRVWDVDIRGEAVVFSIVSPHGEEGYPGTVNASVTYRFSAPGCLELSYEAKTDLATPLSLTNHNYFNLGGHNSGSVGEHLLAVHAECYTKSDAQNVNTGEICAVEGTPLDLRTPQKIAPLLTHSQLKHTNGIDHNFVLSQNPDTPVAKLYCEQSGICMDVYTSMPGMQVYTAGFLDAAGGKDGAFYGAHAGICFETQYHPNSVNLPNFPSPILQPKDVYAHNTSFCFSAKS